MPLSRLPGQPQRFLRCRFMQKNPMPLLIAFACLLGGCALKRALTYPDIAFADYPGGVRFTGYDEGKKNFVFHVIDWAPPKGGSRICPLVLTTGSLTMTQKQFASPAAMRALGGKTQNSIGTYFDVLLNQPQGFAVGVDYTNGRMDRVHVISDNPQNLVTLGGKTVSLPATKAALFAALGPPVKYISGPQINSH